MFDHERLEVYQLELSFVAWVTDLLEEVRENKGARVREVCDQIDRSSLSSLLDTAKGNAKRQPGLRTRYFDDARGSAFDSAACLDALVAKRACTTDRIIAGKQMLVSIVRMLTKPSPIPIHDSVVREERVSYEVEGELD